MKFVLVDDMHLEFSGYTMPGDPEATLLLAGDICTPDVYRPERTDADAAHKREVFDQFFKVECAKYKKAFWIAGNHEYYHGSWEGTHDLMVFATTNTNVTVLRNEWVDLGDDTMLFGGTLWTDYAAGSPIVIHELKRYMNDYRLIRKQSNGHPLQPEDVMIEHKFAKEELEAGLRLYKDKKIVVMTHHAPSLKSTHPRFGGTTNPLNWGYCSEYDGFVKSHPEIKVWVHGHTHDTHDYMLGETRILCNPRGYSWHHTAKEENLKFSDKLSFEV